MSCFTPNGTQDPETYAKCGRSAMCCRTNDDPGVADECLGAEDGKLRGLCKSAFGEYWREGCADRNWDSGQCLKLCTEGQYWNSRRLVDGYNTHVKITICPDSSLCCGRGEDADACCEGVKGQKWMIDGLSVRAFTPTLSMTSSISSTSTPSQEPLVSSTGEPKISNPVTESSDKTAAIAGGVVGGVVGVALLGSVIWILFRRRTKVPEKTNKALAIEASDCTKWELSAGSEQVHEINGDTIRPAELAGNSGSTWSDPRMAGTEVWRT